MIEIMTGDLLAADADALVNTVNTVGVMGKGIALQFRQAYPANYIAYRKACERYEVQPGRMFVFNMGRLTNPKYIINFPTKRHWKEKSHLEDIESGLTDLVRVIEAENIHSIAVPPLGCSNGGLDWYDVRPRIEKALGSLPGVRVLLYPPSGAPNAEIMSVATEQPNMTPGRAALLGALRSYTIPGYRLTLLEVQKLAYFLQVMGEPLRLKYVKGQYGPYAESLNHVLQRIEGHFIRGYGDRSRSSSIRLMPNALVYADEFLQQIPDTVVRLERLSRLINGFETPYGMELLASVHWLVRENPNINHNLDALVHRLHEWNNRKKATFQSGHINVAWSRLDEEGLLESDISTSLPRI